MPIEILLPALSPNMQNAKLAKWFVKEGDRVEVGMVLAEFETDEAIMEVEAVDEGRVLRILVKEGAEKVTVSTPIAIMLTSEDIQTRNALSHLNWATRPNDAFETKVPWLHKFLPSDPTQPPSTSTHRARGIFVSYRRADDLFAAGRIYDRLSAEFGRGHVFMDVVSIPLGVNFINLLREEVATCRILLAVIGKTWSAVQGADGRRRLDDPNDFVRLEIAEALRRDIPVIPILLEGTVMPRRDELPNDLKELSVRHALEVRHSTFHSDMDRLIRELTPVVCK